MANVGTTKKLSSSSLSGSHICNLKFTTQVITVMQWILIWVFQQQHVAIATEVIASSPVNPVDQGGILSVCCQVKDLVASDHDVTLLRTVNGEVQRLSLDEDVFSKVGDRVFVAVRHMGDGSVVYFLSIINVVRTEDEGAYSCSVRKKASGSEVAAATLSVNITYFPSESDPACNDIPTTLSVGDFITLNCSSEIGFPRVNIAWSRAGGDTLLTDIRSEEDRIYATTSFRVKSSDDSAVFLCSISSKQFPALNRQCHVGPINILTSSAPGNVPYNSAINGVGSTMSTGGINRDVEDEKGGGNNNVDDSKMDSNLDTKAREISPTVLAEKCSDVCPGGVTSSTGLYWIVATIVTFIAAILFLVIVCVLISKYYRLTNQKYPVYTAAYPRPGEKIYAELDGRRADNKVYMTIEKCDDPMRQKYLFKSDLPDHYHVTPNRLNP